MRFLATLSLLGLLWFTSDAPRCLAAVPAGPGVLCCCETRHGTCCNTQSACMGMVTGCFCLR